MTFEIYQQIMRVLDAVSDLATFSASITEYPEALAGALETDSNIACWLTLAALDWYREPRVVDTALHCIEDARRYALRAREMYTSIRAMAIGGRLCR